MPGEFERTEAFGAKILEVCVEAGGAITGEHGVGLEKINQMAVQFTDQEISQFHAIKKAFDANETLNPGKGIPTLKRCQEYRSIRSAHTGITDESSCSHASLHDHAHDHNF